MNSTRSNTADFVRRPKREADVPRGLRHDVRRLRQHRIDERRRRCRGAAALRPRSRSGAERLRFEQEIDVEAVAAVGRDAAGRGVRLLDEAFLLEPRQDVADRGRRHAEPGRAHEERRGDGLARRDVFAHKRGQHAAGPFAMDMH